MIYHLTPVRIYCYQKSKTKCWREGVKETLGHCWWEWKLIQSLWETEWRSFKKLKMKLPYCPAFPLWDINLKELKTLFQKI